MEDGNECTICGKVLSRKQRLESHMQSVHGITGNDEVICFHTSETVSYLIKSSDRPDIPDIMHSSCSHDVCKLSSMCFN